MWQAVIALRHPRILPARGIPDTHAAHGHGARRGDGATAGGPSDGGPSDGGPSGDGPSDRGPQRNEPTQQGHAGGRAAPAAALARKSAAAAAASAHSNARPPSPAGLPSHPGGETLAMPIKKDWTSARQSRDRVVEGHVVSGQVRGSRVGVDRDDGVGVGQVGGGIVGRGPWRRPWRRWWPIQPAARGARVVSNYQAGEGRRAAVSRGQTARRQAGAGAESPCIRRESVALVMLVAGRCRCQRARSARR